MASISALANNLLNWNKKFLVSGSIIKKSDIANLFADEFIVKANGRTYEANYDNYLEFLYKFKSDIASISYDIQNEIEGADYITLPLTAYITRTNGTKEVFEAILILQYNFAGKIILWHEVYVAINF
jgi:hypothetical protein